MKPTASKHNCCASRAQSLCAVLCTDQEPVGKLTCLVLGRPNQKYPFDSRTNRTGTGLILSCRSSIQVCDPHRECAKRSPRTLLDEELTAFAAALTVSTARCLERLTTLAPLGVCANAEIC